MNIKRYTLLKKLIHLMAPLHVKLYLAVSCAVLGFLTSVLIPFFIVTQTFLILSHQAIDWAIYIPLMLSLGVLRGIFRYGEHYFGHYIAFRVLANFRNMIFHKLRRLAPTKLDDKKSGVLLKMIGEDIEAIEVFFAHTLPPISTASIVSVLLAIYYMHVSVWVTLVALLTYAILAIYLPIRFAKVLHPLIKQQSQIRKQYMAAFLESLRGMADLVQFKKEQVRFKQLEKSSQHVIEKERQVYQGQAQQTMVTFLVVGISIFVMAILVSYLYLQHTITLQTAVGCTIVFSTSFAPYLELSRLPFGLKKALKAAEDVFNLLDEPEEQTSGEKSIQHIGDISLDNMSFTYPKTEQVIFNQQTIHFPKHKLIGLVGESGSGKSTLMKLIMKWYATTQGTIHIHDTDISQINRHDLQSKIAYIPQIPQLFSQTIRENLTLGKDIPDDIILKTAEKCYMKERILAAPKGLDTLVNSQSHLFSSGEKQRLELIRALLSGAECYVFDEPTSFLDSLNEAAFLNVVKQHCKGSVFLISHRDSTVSCADIVYKVENQQLIKLRERG
ncbi:MULTISPECIES: ABC transporter ATP-binding protein [unclassified Granulicatella]|uniref:ABC transporter ATP-binding protein n=1 Tax=unclassified Granulicatella TaxID=2630493 RepID=UPI0010740421|nr:MULTISPECIES: ABC transporter ATP-binding protein [unclassified Granulicatella]MBF0779869.1 ABC transporter ATP-binding protein [Granulicatella sp. 19428wC4_WM01]TFU96073.1 ABC transporter ATP-binding protein [Granulicatella sp. WM01]